MPNGAGPTASLLLSAGSLYAVTSSSYMAALGYVPTMAETLTAIHVYPVKSCRAVPLDRVEIVSTGLRGDRLFQVVDAEGNPVTQRQQPMLATVRTGFPIRTLAERSILVGMPAKV